VLSLHRHARNLVSLVHSADGRRYILRLTAPQHGRLAYELNLVTRLQDLSLPFAIPAPIPAAGGQLFVRLPRADEQIALLYPFVAGVHSTGANQRQAHAAGRALAKLQAALATLDQPPPPATTAPPAAGDLHTYHPLVGDPVVWIGELALASDQHTRLRTLIDDVYAQIPRLYATLPRQLIHNDYDPSNVLLPGQRIVAVLDFEMCTTDLRAIDLAVALGWWPRAAFADPRRWTVMDAFGRGYARAAGLSVEEAAALPTLLRLRTVATLLERVGRYLEGRDSAEVLRRRIEWTLAVHTWLSGIEDELRRRAAAWC